jgi:aminoglycoside phosphotransferase (APT) family kinase protein
MTGSRQTLAKLHEGEPDIDARLIVRLLQAQFPHLAGLPVHQVDSAGTVNAIYRLGPELYARLPRVLRWAADLEKEWHWLPRLAPHLSLQVPEPVALGQPAGGYPFTWAIYRWLDGELYGDDVMADEREAAADLARFITELRGIVPAADAPRGGRKPLRELDAPTRAAIHASGRLINTDAALAAWDLALASPPWAGKPVWIHSDLLRPNLLVADRQLRAVIDFGGAGVGDPAGDVIAAWSVFGPVGRAAFRDALGVDDGTWLRALGIALHQAAGLVPYYQRTNPRLAAEGQRTIREILADVPGLASQ